MFSHLPRFVPTTKVRGETRCLNGFDPGSVRGNNHAVIKQLEGHKMLAADRMQHFDAYIDPVTHQIQQTIYLARRNAKPADKTDLFAANTPIAETGLGPCCRGETVAFANLTDGQTAIEARLRDAGMCSALAVPLMVENELFGIALT